MSSIKNMVIECSNNGKNYNAIFDVQQKRVIFIVLFDSDKLETDRIEIKVIISIFPALNSLEKFKNLLKNDLKKKKKIFQIN